MVNRPNTAAQRKQRHARVRGKTSARRSVRACACSGAKATFMPRSSTTSTATLWCLPLPSKRTLKATAATWKPAKKIGSKIAERALAKGIEEVVFDRGGYIYHGRVKALAEAAREGGLKF